MPILLSPFISDMLASMYGVLRQGESSIWAFCTHHGESVLASEALLQ